MYSCQPNPRVGCVLVRNGEVVGEGWHRVAGGPHAEIVALAAAGDRARGATAYVTLEPCSHHGKTPPCSDALIKAGVSDVVFAAADPNARVDGMAVLQSAGIGVRQGLLAGEAQSLNEGFFSRMQRQRPLIRLKVATSLDGATAMADGSSQWITGGSARADVQRWRASAGAVLTGIGTVIADDPSLTVRDATIETAGRQPIRVIIDSHLRTPATSRFLQLPGRSVIYCIDDARRKVLEDAGAEVFVVAAEAGQVSLAAVARELAALEVNDVLVEAGPALAGAFLQAGLVDELVIYQAPHIMGSETRGMFGTQGWTSLQDRQALKLTDVRRVGEDMRIIARPVATKRDLR
jgi:diaminohydroxyphosphoribosylaminopyrimidine deaminase/5-amino-6-(5-phosphoribosylamino)uracil reductase